jgi:hypothetical protein
MRHILTEEELLEFQQKAKAYDKKFVIEISEHFGFSDGNIYKIIVDDKEIENILLKRIKILEDKNLELKKENEELKKRKFRLF